MNVSSELTRPLVAGRDYPKFEGRVKIKLHNCRTHTDDYVYENHNAVTDALADIFAQNYGGLINYQNFADLFNTWLGGVLLFENALDTTSSGWEKNYGIPAYTSNPITAHAGRTPLETAGDDSTRGNPLETSTATVLSENSTKLTWEWGTSQGNGTIASLGLTHTDTGNYMTNAQSNALKSFAPFASVGNMTRSYSYGDNSNAVLAINNNEAYTFYLYNDNGTSKVHIYKTPINVTKYKLQGGALLPITAYTDPVVTATLPNSYNIGGSGDCYYWFDFANSKLVLFGVPTVLGSTLYRDDIDLTSGVVTHSTITVTGAKLYKFRCKEERWYPTVDGSTMSVPTQALIHNGNLYVYGCSDSSHTVVADTMYRINLANTGDVDEVDTSTMGTFTAEAYNDSWSKTLARHTSLGGLLVQDNFIINGDKVLQTASTASYRTNNYPYALRNSISAPVCGIGVSPNIISVCKLYLATMFNLPSPVTKSASQSMTVEYTLTETA